MRGGFLLYTAWSEGLEQVEVSSAFISGDSKARQAVDTGAAFCPWADFLAEPSHKALQDQGKGQKSL